MTRRWAWGTREASPTLGRAAGRAGGYTPSPMNVRRPVALLAVLSLALSACRRDAGPAERYRAFADATHDGRADDVWAMLSEQSRAELDRRAKDLAAKAPGVVAASGRAMVLGDLSALAPPPTSVVVVRESKGAAVLAVEVEGRPAREVTLVREGGVWRVVVPFDK